MSSNSKAKQRQKTKDDLDALERQMDAMQKQIDELSGVAAARREIAKMKRKPQV